MQAPCQLLIFFVVFFFFNLFYLYFKWLFQKKPPWSIFFLPPGTRNLLEKFKSINPFFIGFF